MAIVCHPRHETTQWQPTLALVGSAFSIMHRTNRFTMSNTPHEEHLATRRAYDGHILRVRVDDVRLPSGRESVREMVEHPGSAVVLPITTDGDVVLIRQFRYTTGETLIELPAGLIDPGETPEQTARRELTEETGYQAGEIELLGAAYVSPGYSQELSHFFVAIDCVSVDHEPDEDEPVEVLHMALDDLPDMLASGESTIRNAQALLALNWYLRLYPRPHR
jgi:ADP-ribose pyrophosphatase